MTISRQEEIIAALWLIAALLAFGFGYQVLGWVLAVKAAADTACALYYAAIEVAAENRAKALKRLWSL